MRCAFVFRRDLRLTDNTALMRAEGECDVVLPVFFLDPRQVRDNPYLSLQALEFMLESLESLNAELMDVGSRLHVLKGIPEELVGKLRVDSVYVNEDYTPFSLRRDQGMRAVLESKGRRLVSYEDYLLTGRDFFLKHGPFTVFAHFYRRASELEVRKPSGSLLKKLVVDDSLPGVEVLKEVRGRKGSFTGGREHGLELLKRARELDYSKKDFMWADQTSHLSPYLKFGVLSVREVYYGVEDGELRRQLYWRDFFTLLSHFNPRVFQEPFRREYRCLTWENDPVKIKAWTEGKTGYPIIDAGMRELRETGFINGRGRLLVSSFLVKVLHVDWRIGERYFATQLVDYDPSVNNGNWQWVASTGTDYMFRIFNPWIQQRKYDPEARYVKRWVEELRDLEPEVIHNIYKYDVRGYPKPIVDYHEEVRRAKREYERARRECIPESSPDVDEGS